MTLEVPPTGLAERAAASDRRRGRRRAAARGQRSIDALDPVPAGLVERVQFGITLDALHAEIAELQRTADLVGVRSGEATRGADGDLHQRESDDDGHDHPDVGRTGCGSTAGPRPARGVVVELRTADGTLSTAARRATGGSCSRTCRVAWRSSCCAARQASTQSAVVTPSIEI